MSNKILIYDEIGNIYSFDFKSDIKLKKFLFMISDHRIKLIEYQNYEIDSDEIDHVLYYCLHRKIQVRLLNLFEHPILQCFDISFSEPISKSEHSRGVNILTPKETWDYLKQNISALIISFNNFTFLKMMVNQLKKYTKDIIILDNNSSFPPLIEYLKSLESEYTIFRFDKNYGYTIYKQERIQNLVGPIYLLTDPDIQLNPNLPSTFIREFYELSKQYQRYKVGPALDIFSDDIRTDVKSHSRTIYDWESQNWKVKIPNEKFELYPVGIDTTFCLVNTNYPTGSWNSNSLRVAGNYTAKHLPWHKNWQSLLMENEYETYMKDNNSTNWCK
jgi:hypothetical protein